MLYALAVRSVVSDPYAHLLGQSFRNFDRPLYRPVREQRIFLFIDVRTQPFMRSPRRPGYQHNSRILRGLRSPFATTFIDDYIAYGRDYLAFARGRGRALCAASSNSFTRLLSIGKPGANIWAGSDLEQASRDRGDCEVARPHKFLFGDVPNATGRMEHSAHSQRTNADLSISDGASSLLKRYDASARSMR